MRFNLDKWQIAAIFGFLSASTFPIGAFFGVFCAILGKTQNRQILSFFLSFGAGTLIFAVTVELYAQSLQDIEKHGEARRKTITFICGIISALVGAFLYIIFEKQGAKFRGKIILKRSVINHSSNSYKSINCEHIKDINECINGNDFCYVEDKGKSCGAKRNETNEICKRNYQLKQYLHNEIQDIGKVFFTDLPKYIHRERMLIHHGNLNKTGSVQFLPIYGHYFLDLFKKADKYAALGFQRKSLTPSKELYCHSSIDSWTNADYKKSDIHHVKSGNFTSNEVVKVTYVLDGAYEKMEKQWEILTVDELDEVKCEAIVDATLPLLDMNDDSGNQPFVFVKINSFRDYGETAIQDELRQIHHFGERDETGKMSELKNLLGLALMLWLSQAVDAFPEAMMIGFRTVDDNLSWAFVISVMISNFPEAFSSGYIMKMEHMNGISVVALWLSVSMGTAIISSITAYLSTPTMSVILPAPQTSMSSGQKLGYLMWSKYLDTKFSSSNFFLSPPSSISQYFLSYQSLILENRNRNSSLFAAPQATNISIEHLDFSNSDLVPICSSIVQGLAGGAMLALVSASMLPVAFRIDGALSGVFCVLGFLFSVSVRLFFGILEVHTDQLKVIHRDLYLEYSRAVTRSKKPLMASSLNYTTPIFAVPNWGT